MDIEWTPLIKKSVDDSSSSKTGALIVCYLELVFGIIGATFAFIILPGNVQNESLWLAAFITLLILCPLAALYGIYQDVTIWVVIFVLIDILNSTISFIQALKVTFDEEKSDKALGLWFIFAFNCCTMMVLYVYCRDKYLAVLNYCEGDDVENAKIRSKN